MKKTIFIIITIILLFNGCTNSTQQYNANIIDNKGNKQYGINMASQASKYMGEKNYKEAKYYLEEASKSNSLKASIWAKSRLGFMYLYGNGVPKNYSKAKQYFREAIDGGDINAKFSLGGMYLEGKGVEQDYYKAKQYFEEAANSGNVYAQAELGRMYLEGKGSTKDFYKAKQYLEKAISGGNFYANIYLGLIYLNGKGVEQDYAKAKQYFKKSKSYSYLGWMFYTGDDSVKDYKQAKYYFEKDMNNNENLSKSNLGLMYFRGQGVEQDYKQAKQYFEDAASHNFAKSKNNLAWMYLNGLGVKKDINKALSLFKEATNSDQYSISAKLNLTWIYKNGIGVEIDNKKAKFWQDKVNEEDEDAIKNNYELTYTFDKPKFTDDIVAKLKAVKQKKKSDKSFLIAIGIENYEYSDEIKYSNNSTDMFIKVAQKTLGIPSYNTLSLINADASMGKIKFKMKKLLRQVKKGDTVYFYYSGHGIPVISQKNEPYILPSDIEPEYISEDKFFKLKNIYKTLTDSKASKVVAFVDSCFSGATDGKSIIKGVAASRLVPKIITFNKNKMALITAGKGNQYSNMYEEKEHRLFTYFVMKSLLKGRTDINDIYREVYMNVKDESYKMGDMKLQEPTIDGNLKLKL